MERSNALLILLLLIGGVVGLTALQKAKADAIDAGVLAHADLLLTALLDEHGVGQPWPACAPGACVTPAVIQPEHAEATETPVVWRVASSERGGEVCVRDAKVARCACATSGERPVTIPCADAGL